MVLALGVLHGLAVLGGGVAVVGPVAAGHVTLVEDPRGRSQLLAVGTEVVLGLPRLGMA